MTTGDLRLADYRPKQELRVRWAGAPERPAFAVIDAHNHLGETPFSGEWRTRPAEQLAATLDEAGIAALVDLDGLHGDALRREMARWAPLGGRVAVFAGLDHGMWATWREFGEEEARRLRSAAAAGARGLKISKVLGLRARDASGALVAVDDSRLDPIWATAGELALPVTIHVADPIAFFRPLDASNERWEELRAHPDWHFWPVRAADAPADAPGFPPFDQLLDQLATVVARHPATTFIGAHVGCAPEDLGRVEAMLAASPNWHVDIAARLAELGRQPYSARAFIERWADRVLFGTDAPPDLATYGTHWRFLETRDESFPYDPDGAPGSQGRWAIHGLGLPSEVLRKIYATNARRLIFPDLPVAAVPHRTLHLLPADRWAAWQAAPADERYAPDAFATEGFIHCTDGADEMLGVANRFYAGVPGDFVVVVLDLGEIGVPWRYDDPAGTYPHVYGRLPRSAVRGAVAFHRDGGGRFTGYQAGEPDRVPRGS